MPPFRISDIFLVTALTVGLSATAAQAEEAPIPLELDLGGGVSATIYGYVKADFIWDEDFDLGKTTSGIKNIGLPTGPAAGSFDRQQLNETRIGFDVRGPNDLFARFEGDFFGTDDSLRLRHAYLAWQGLMIGQNWTNFMSVEALANTVDFQGPGALPFARVPQLRYTYDGLADWSLSASVEEDIANSDDYALTFAARYGLDPGMLRVSGLWRDVTVAGTAIDGWGLNLTGVLTPWQGGTIKANLTTGKGISDILAAGLTGNARSINGKAVGVNSAALSVTHQVTPSLLLAATGSWVGVDDATGTDTDTLGSLHLSAFYTLGHNTTLMAEVFHGRRSQADGRSFDADRIQLAVKFAF